MTCIGVEGWSVEGWRVQKWRAGDLQWWKGKRLENDGVENRVV